MKWWLLGGGAVVLAAAVWYFGFAKIARALIGLVADGLTGFREWIAKPGSKLKFLCAVLALISAMMGLQSFQKGRQIVRIQTEFVEYQREADETIHGLKQDIAGRDQRIAEFVRIAVEEKAKLEALAKQAAGAEAAAAKAKAQAAKSQAAYDRLWQNRPNTCSAALELMQSECSSLGDY